MAIKKMPIGKFVSELETALKRKDGYIMGTKGQNPKKWAVNSWWYTQYDGKQLAQALEWREKCERVWDCNGMAEGIYEDFSGVNINTKARYNYSGWCDPKGTGSIPAKYRVPGAAVFIHSKSSGYITHVGYLYKPVEYGNPSGDWYVIEARGVLYGVVRTRLSERGWNRWGWMTKYFDYAESTTPDNAVSGGLMLGERLLKNGCEGNDVKQLQEALIRLGYDCGKWGADGEFGDATELAVEDFQTDYDLVVDGKYGEKTHAALEMALAIVENPVDNPKTVKVSGGNCWVRSKPSTDGEKLGVAKSGSKFVYAGQTAENGWHLIDFNGQKGWISGKYGKREG